MNLNMKLSTKLGGQAGGQPKIWWGHGPLRLPLRTATAHAAPKHLCAAFSNFSVTHSI